MFNVHKENKTKIYIRKYNPDFLKRESVFSGDEESPMPQLVISFETVSNECMKLLKLKSYNLKHTECVGKSFEFFSNPAKKTF